MFSFHQIIPRVKNQFPLGSSTKLDPQAQSFKEQVSEISKKGEALETSDRESTRWVCHRALGLISSVKIQKQTNRTLFF